VGVAFPLLAITLTGQPLKIAAVAITAQLPWLVFSLPAGALADRADRQRLVLIVEGLRAAVLAAVGLVVLTGRTTLVVLYLAAFSVGTLETVFSAATTASVPDLVHHDDLPSANGYLLAAETAGEQFAGPALGGLAFAWIRAVPFLLDALSFVASAALLRPALASAPNRNKRSEESLVSEMRTGLRWFRQQSLMRQLAFTVATFAFCQSAVLSIMVLYGHRVLHLSSGRYGVFLAFGAIGDVVGSFIAQRTHDRLGPPRAIACAAIAAAAGYLVLAATATPAVAVCGYALEAVAVALGNVTTVSLRQRLIPSGMFGRVNNIFRTFVLGAVPLGALAGGLLATGLGVRATFLVAGLLQVGVVIVTVRRLTAEITRSATD
jgi:predicted MFS family arabinose efflux permease